MTDKTPRRSGRPLHERARDLWQREGWRGPWRRVPAYVLRRAASRLSQLADSVETATAGLLIGEEVDLLRANAALHRVHEGKRAFVIGNGPSLATQDLSRLGQEITCVMSAFWKHPAVEAWSPSYYFLADPLFFDGTDPMNRFLADMGAHCRDSTFVVPLYGRHRLREQRPWAESRTRYVSLGRKLSAGLSAPIDLTRPIPLCQSVSQLAILVALAMGCRPIYLLGLDHDWLAQRGMDRHFYAGTTVSGHPRAHGDLDRVRYREDLEGVLELWRGYEVLDAVARTMNVQILNATAGGFLDVFERIDFEDV